MLPADPSKFTNTNDQLLRVESALNSSTAGCKNSLGWTVIAPTRLSTAHRYSVMPRVRKNHEVIVGLVDEPNADPR